VEFRMLVLLYDIRAQTLKITQAEDWQSEKCNVSLLESVPTGHILSKLEEAGNWLFNTTKRIVLAVSPSMTS
jgi:hypothetical protein